MFKAIMSRLALVAVAYFVVQNAPLLLSIAKLLFHSVIVISYTGFFALLFYLSFKIVTDCLQKIKDGIQFARNTTLNVFKPLVNFYHHVRGVTRTRKEIEGLKEDLANQEARHKHELETLNDKATSANEEARDLYREREILYRQLQNLKHAKTYDSTMAELMEEEMKQRIERRDLIIQELSQENVGLRKGCKTVNTAETRRLTAELESAKQRIRILEHDQRLQSKGQSLPSAAEVFLKKQLDAAKLAIEQVKLGGEEEVKKMRGEHEREMKKLGGEHEREMRKLGEEYEEKMKKLSKAHEQEKKKTEEDFETKLLKVRQTEASHCQPVRETVRKQQEKILHLEAAYQKERMEHQTALRQQQQQFEELLASNEQLHTNTLNNQVQEVRSLFQQHIQERDSQREEEQVRMVQGRMLEYSAALSRKDDRINQLEKERFDAFGEVKQHKETLSMMSEQLKRYQKKVDDQANSKLEAQKASSTDDSQERIFALQNRVKFLDAQVASAVVEKDRLLEDLDSEQERNGKLERRVKALAAANQATSGQSTPMSTGGGLRFPLHPMKVVARDMDNFIFVAKDLFRTFGTIDGPNSDQASELDKALNYMETAANLFSHNIISHKEALAGQQWYKVLKEARDNLQEKEHNGTISEAERALITKVQKVAQKGSRMGLSGSI